MNSPRFQNAPLASRPSWLPSLGIGLLSLILLGVSLQRQYNPNLSLFEDGPRLAAIQAFLQGGTPYRDFFLHYGILQEVIRPYLAFHLWGTTYESYLRFGTWMTALGIVGLFGICAQVLTLRHGVWIVAVGVLLWRSDFFMPERALFSVWSVWAFCRYLKTRRVKWMLISGALAAGTLMYSLEMGLTLLLGYFLFFLSPLTIFKKSRDQFPSSTWWWTGLLAPLLFFGFYLIYNNTLGFFLSDMVAMFRYRPASWAGSHTSRLFDLGLFHDSELLRSRLYLLFAPLLSLAAITYSLKRQNEQMGSLQRLYALLLSFMLFTHFLIYLSRSDFEHWLNSSFFLFPLLALSMEGCLTWSSQPQNYGLVNKPTAIVSTAVLSLIFLSMLIGPGPFTSFLFEGFRLSPVHSGRVSVLPGRTPPPRLGLIPTQPEMLTDVSRITEEIQRRVPDEGYFFDFSNQGGFYFLTGRRNPTRFGVVELIHGPAMIQDCLNDLEKRTPEVVLAGWDGKTFTCRPDLTPIRDYLVKNYHIQIRQGPWVLLTRNKAAP